MKIGEASTIPNTAGKFLRMSLQLTFTVYIGVRLSRIAIVS
jgi:hypothetical protein